MTERWWTDVLGRPAMAACLVSMIVLLGGMPARADNAGSGAANKETAGATGTDPTRAGDAQAGKVIFHRECAVCHGDRGLGDGPAASLMHPRPRNFQQGLFKLRSTESGELPTDNDLIATVTNGIHGTGMPSFRDLGRSDLTSVVAFVKTLGGPEGEKGSWFELYEVPPPAEVPPMPAAGPSRKAEGKTLYEKMGCAGCHGAGGKGDGKPAEEMKDNWGEPLHARDFTLGVYKGGASPRDIYMRIMTGMDGTPMTGFWKDAMTVPERWAIVRYILSLGKAREARQPSRGVMKVSNMPIPSGASGSSWKGVPEQRLGRMALEGGWMQYFGPAELQATMEGERLALRLSWDDGPNSCARLRVGFVPGSSAATFFVGSQATPMTVWHWARKSGAGVAISVAPGEDKPTSGTLDVREEKNGDSNSVVLIGTPPPSGARQIRVEISGCTPRGRYRTSSSVQALHE